MESKSIWKATAGSFENKNKGPLRGNIRTDVAIIGGGMAGILCAYKLRERGVECVVLEKDHIGHAVSGNTTAKITAQHSLLYDKLIDKKGEGAARQYYDVNMAAVDDYRNLSKTIDCDFEEKTAYVFSTEDPQKVKQEAAAYAKLNIPHHMQNKTPLPIQSSPALGMERQGQFHPLKLLYGLAKDLDIYEDTCALEIEGNKVLAQHGTVQAKHIVFATHFPMVNIPGLYFMKLYQHRSYVIALKDGPQLDGMYIDDRKNGHSFRNYGNYLLIGGGDHQTGKQGGCYDELRGLAKHAYPGLVEDYAWAAQDCMSLDGLPYIGVHRSGAPHLYVVTGFNKWGMTGSMVSATVLSDLICAGKSDYEKLFSPGRSMLQPQLLLNAAHSLSGYLSFGKRCPHMGCALKWNPVERSWDCPCHGSRFAEDGHVRNNPAKRGLRI